MIFGLEKEIFFLQTILHYIWQLIKNWWWVPFPFFLWRPFFYFWLFWRNEIWIKKVYKPIILEIKLPREIEKPIRAMENVMAGIHGVIYHPPDDWERIIDGQTQTSIEFSIVSIGGEVHFYIRFWEIYRKAVEAAIFSQYPEVEIVEVEDYTKKIPEIPNKDWNLWATDYRLLKPDPYPIKTYPKFETEQEKEPEKIIDPIANLLEGLAQLKPGEQFWIQIIATPLSGAEELGFPKGTSYKFLQEGLVLRDKLAKRGGKPKPKSASEEILEGLIWDPLQVLVWGPKTETPKEQKKEEIFPPEMKLTPGEKEIVQAVENKISKPVFRVRIRFIYLAKRDIYNTSTIRIGFNFFNCFATANLNSLQPWGGTITKIKKSIFFPPLNLLRPRRDYIRRRRIFRSYRERLNTLYPRSAADKGIFVLNTEELATLWHFPSWRVAPMGVPRIETKKRPPPSF